MMKIFKVFSKELMGARYERVMSNVFSAVVIFMALYTAKIELKITPVVLFLTSTVVTATAMWKCIFSHSNKDYLMEVFMLPFRGKELIFSYVFSLSIYSFITKTSFVIAVLFAICDWNIYEILLALFCCFNACSVTALCYILFKRKNILFMIFLVITQIGIIFIIHKTMFLIGIILISIFISWICILNTDSYIFYDIEKTKYNLKHFKKKGRVGRYLFRYLIYHKNYLINTVGLWIVACFLPQFFKNFQGVNVIPLGFAILSLNTPIGILISCDHDLQRAMEVLPGQENNFDLPYLIFIFIFNIIANFIYICSLQIQIGGVSRITFLTAVLFAVQSSILQVILEWKYPILNWKIESDLWHHPRKYCVPLIMVVLATFIGIYSKFIFVLLLLVIFEILILKFRIIYV